MLYDKTNPQALRSHRYPHEQSIRVGFRRASPDRCRNLGRPPAAHGAGKSLFTHLRLSHQNSLYQIGTRVNKFVRPSARGGGGRARRGGAHGSGLP
ncbi:hypothetical protein EVAR_80158_1 [Eumeta japonica]|uniref:Uncharacterized protein n=1 Tax=Eumeta variegata TaxID=151549 RepID=A0A4C1YBD1_EUMVA|nr:hypothetical protein EVAR_80158_1 [Eumeta japonica]